MIKIRHYNQGLTIILKKEVFAIFFLSLVIFNYKTNAQELNINQIDDYLARSEQQFSDIVDGTQKKVRWYQEQSKKTEYAIIYLHGFSASSQEISPTTETLSDKLKANAFYTRLTGHGRSDDAMAEASLDAWKRIH